MYVRTFRSVLTVSIIVDNKR